MSLHPSLRIDKAGAKERTVLTRIERIKDLMKRGSWKDGQDVTGLPKVKLLKVKARRKVKEEKKEEGAPDANVKSAAAPAGKAPAVKASAAKK